MVHERRSSDRGVSKINRILRLGGVRTVTGVVWGVSGIRQVVCIETQKFYFQLRYRREENIAVQLSRYVEIGERIGDDVAAFVTICRLAYEVKGELNITNQDQLLVPKELLYRRLGIVDG